MARPAPSTNDYLNRKWSGSLSDPRLNGKVDEADLEYLYDYWTHWDHVTKLRLYRSSGMLADEVLNDPMAVSYTHLDVYKRQPGGSGR